MAPLGSAHRYDTAARASEESSRRLSAPGRGLHVHFLADVPVVAMAKGQR